MLKSLIKSQSNQQCFVFVEIQIFFDIEYIVFAWDQPLSFKSEI